jgi:hypothetical protein
VWLVLCASTDVTGIWAYQGLKRRGLPAELVTAELLVYSARWEHSVSDAGATVRAVLPDGREICSARVRGTLNRLAYLPTAHLERAAPSERDYAIQEWTAFFLSWLSCLPGPMLNRPTPQGLSGSWRHPSEWAWLAAGAGLPTARYAEGSSHGVRSEEAAFLFVPEGPIRTVFAVGECVVGTEMPKAIKEGCLRLAASAGTRLLGIQFAAGPAGPWTFLSATPTPDLSLGGERLLDCLAGALQEENER